MQKQGDVVSGSNSKDWTICGQELTREQMRQARLLGLSWQTLYMRVKRGKSLEEALKQNKQVKGKRK